MATVAGLFRIPEQADGAVQALMNAGFDESEINVMARDEVVQERIPSAAVNAASVATSGARGGAIAGGIGGLLIGLGIIAIPGLGPILATGSLAAALGSTVAGAGLGAATGGVLGALAGLGIPERDAPLYAEGIKRGGVLVAVTADEGNIDEARTILKAHGAVDMEGTRSEWTAAGWTGFDETVTPDHTYPRL